MKSIIRFFEDILGYFMEKFPPLWKALTLGGITLIIFLVWGFQNLLYVVSVILWAVSFFMLTKLLVNVIKDRNREGHDSGKGLFN
jgi:tetrahydromethanopterin S-methyltransferase subunit C